MTEMEDGISDVEIEELGNSMKDKLKKYMSLDTVHADGSEFCLIPRIHEHIRMIDRDSYEPLILSIGPYHNGSSALSFMERKKWNCLDYILKLNCQKGLKDYLTIINRLEKRARSCYSGDIKMNKRKFLQTLLLDGCFVLVSLSQYNEFLWPDSLRYIPSPSNDKTFEGALSFGDHQKVTGRNESQQVNKGKQSAMKSTQLDHDRHSMEEYSISDIELSSEISGQYQDPSQQIGQWYDMFVPHDLLLLENQISLFVIQGIHEIVVSKLASKLTTTTALRRSIVQCIEQFVPCYPKAIRESNRPKDFDHLLHLCHMYVRPSPNQDEHHGHTGHHIRHFLQLGWDYLHLTYKQEAANLGSSQNGHFPYRWRRASQYHEAGIEFRRRAYSESNRHSLLDIKLRDAVLEIPFLLVDESTSFLFRNFVALEQTCPKVGNDVTAYVIFMAKLMNMPDDVALLARKGIIAHHLRTDRDVSQLFTKLTKGVVFDFYGNYYLMPLSLALEAHYQNRLHRWIAWLKHNHLSNPWLAVAGLAGVIVLFCTVAQTVLTVLSYVDPR